PSSLECDRLCSARDGKPIDPGEVQAYRPFSIRTAAHIRALVVAVGELLDDGYRIASCVSALKMCILCMSMTTSVECPIRAWLRASTRATMLCSPAVR